MEVKNNEKIEIHKNKRRRKNNKRYYKAHDSVIKEILIAKQELIFLMRDFMKINLSKKDIENFNGEYRLKRGLKTRLLDVIYKIKKEESFITIEHQSTVDYKMGERINEHAVAIIGSREEQMENSKNRKAPIIYPIVLSTARGPWDAAITIIQEENNKYRLPALTYPKYNLIDVNNYTVEYLLERRTGIAVGMAFEKIRNKEDLEYIIKKLKSFKKVNYWEKRAMRIILEKIEGIMPWIVKELTKEEIGKLKREIMEIINKGGDFMSNFEKAFKKIVEEEGRKERENGMQRGIKRGEEQGIRKTIKGFLSQNVDDEIIINATGISRKELEKLKLEVV